MVRSIVTGAQRRNTHSERVVGTGTGVHRFRVVAAGERLDVFAKGVILPLRLHVKALDVLSVLDLPLLESILAVSVAEWCERGRGRTGQERDAETKQRVRREAECDRLMVSPSPLAASRRTETLGPMKK